MTGGTLSIGSFGELEIATGQNHTGATLDGVTVDITSGGSIQVDGSDTLTLSGTTINGGTINDFSTAGGGTIHVNGTSTIAGISGTNADLTGDGAGSTVQLDAALTLDYVTLNDITIENGTTLTSGPLTILDTVEVAGPVELLNDAVTNTATGIIQVDNGDTLTLSGTTINGGTINDFGGTGTGVANIDVIAGTSTSEIAGTGTGTNEANLNGNSLTNSTVTLDAALILDYVKLNDITIENGTTLPSGLLTIENTVEVAGPVELLNDTVTNTGATLQVDNGKTLKLNGTTINGGTINDGTSLGTVVGSNTVYGAIDVTGSSTISGANLNNGKVTVEAGQTLTLAGTDNISGGIFSFGGGSVQASGNNVVLSGVSVGDRSVGSPTRTLTITASSGSFTLLSMTGLTVVGGLDGSTGTLEVTGTLLAISAALTSGLTYSPGGNSNTLKITVDDSSIGGTDAGFKIYSIDTTNIASPVLKTIGASGAIVNSDLIDITGTTTLTDATLFNSGATVKVETSKILELDHTGIFGGTIIDNGEVEIVGRGAINNGNLNIGISGQVAIDANALLKLSGTTVSGGPINISSGGSIEVVGSSTVTSSVITDATSSIIQIDNGATLTLSGTTINGGTINDFGGTGTGVANIDVIAGTSTSEIAGTGTGTNEANLNGNSLTNSTVTLDAALILDYVKLNDITIKNGITLTSGPLTIENTVEVAGAVKLLNDTVTNTGATLQVDNGKTLTLSSTTINGGTINDYSTLGGGNIHVTGTSEIAGISGTDANLNGNGTGTVKLDAALTLDYVTVDATAITDDYTSPIANGDLAGWYDGDRRRAIDRQQREPCHTPHRKRHRHRRGHPRQC